MQLVKHQSRKILERINQLSFKYFYQFLHNVFREQMPKKATITIRDGKSEIRNSIIKFREYRTPGLVVITNSPDRKINFT